MLKLKVNNIDVEVEEGLTVLQACEKAGLVPLRFVLHVVIILRALITAILCAPSPEDSLPPAGELLPARVATKPTSIRVDPKQSGHSPENLEIADSSWPGQSPCLPGPAFLSPLPLRE